jgi:hypothetical protein
VRLLVFGRCMENGGTNFPPSPPHGRLRVCWRDSGTACLFSEFYQQMVPIHTLKTVPISCFHSFLYWPASPLQTVRVILATRFSMLNTFVLCKHRPKTRLNALLPSSCSGALCIANKGLTISPNGQCGSLSNSTCHLDFPTQLPDSKLVRILKNHSSSQPTPLLFGSSILDRRTFTLVLLSRVQLHLAQNWAQQCAQE